MSEAQRSARLVSVVIWTRSPEELLKFTVYDVAVAVQVHKAKIEAGRFCS